MSLKHLDVLQGQYVFLKGKGEKLKGEKVSSTTSIWKCFLTTLEALFGLQAYKSPFQAIFRHKNRAKNEGSQ